MAVCHTRATTTSKPAQHALLHQHRSCSKSYRWPSRRRVVIDCSPWQLSHASDGNQWSSGPQRWDFAAAVALSVPRDTIYASARSYAKPRATTALAHRSPLINSDLPMRRGSGSREHATCATRWRRTLVSSACVGRPVLDAIIEYRCIRWVAESRPTAAGLVR